jgi:hypothetical protein
LIKGTSGLNGELREFIIDVISRPYPQRVSGDIQSFGYDMSKKKFTLAYRPGTESGVTMIFIPVQRDYSNGFTVDDSAGITLRFAPSSSSGTVIDNPGHIDAGTFSYDQTEQLLAISGQVGTDVITITIGP